MIIIDTNLCLTFFWLSISAGIVVPGIWLLIDGKTNLSLINLCLERLYLFGKLKNENPTKKKVFGDVSKSYFLHFYIVGFLINIILFIFHPSSFLLLIFFLSHILRRLYECLYVHRFGSNSTMSIIHYFIGLIHYPFVGLTMITDHEQPYRHSNIPILHYFLALILFLAASFVQYRVHCTLAENRRTDNKIYPIPSGYWPFEYLSCPNYIAEIVIYVSFLLVSHRTSSMLAMTVWVFINQSLSALLAHRWYCQHYGQIYPSKRRALIPFVL